MPKPQLSLSISTGGAFCGATWTDTERLNWLEKQSGAGLISDDAGHWAVSFDGSQNVPDNPPQDISTLFFVEEGKWRLSIREAINKAILIRENRT